MARTKLTLFTTIWLAIAAMLPGHPAAAAAGTPSVTLQTSKSAVNAGDEFTVTVQGNDLQDVYAYEVDLYYDPGLLSFKKGSETTSAVGFSTQAAVSQDGGTHVVFAHTKTGNTAGDSESLTLATFTFEALTNGSAELKLPAVKTVSSSLASSTIDTDSDAIVLIGPSGGSSSGSGGAPTAPVSPAAPDGVMTVGAEELKPDGSGKVTVSLAEGYTTLKLPADTAALLGNAPLYVTAGSAELEIPPGMFTQLTDQLTSGQRKDGTIALTVKTAADDTVKPGADAALASPVYTFALQWMAADGSVYELHQFNQPVTLRLRSDEDADSKLSAIYYFPDGGAPEYIGGVYEDGIFTAPITHFSAYAVMEIDKTFFDVPEGYWASPAIKELYAKRIVTGTGDTTFEPLRTVTRAEFTALLVRALGLTDKAALKFGDVPAGAWYAQDVAAAVQAGIVQGVSGAKFAPGAAISREEMVTMAMRGYEAAKGKPAEAAVPASYKDEASISSWAIAYVKEATGLGLVKGRTSAAFVPHGTANRAEAAQLIDNMIHKLNDK
ncbi:S-layer homology domain-containing protein [Paenibacillus humicola]|uniref:S-layer homology domain-containing protein n=1 Tax=Paenibacillus humicola TaxID=3110540 RepID=UPI00237B64D5|nr:S-layer homology domain-containing protein [Paenibacillus humicola]